MTPQDIDLRIAHIGINAQDAEESEDVARRFCALLGLQLGQTPVSHMAGLVVEVMNDASVGEHGHIGLHVNSVEAAEPYFAAHGFTVNEATRRRNPDGTTFLVYLNESIAGFALHLTIEGDD